MRKKKSRQTAESHMTAAWTDEEAQKPLSKVTEPTEQGVIEAKDYVDENQK